MLSNLGHVYAWNPSHDSHWTDQDGHNPAYGHSIELNGFSGGCSYLTEVFCGTSKDTRRPPAELLELASPQAISGTTWGKKKGRKK